MALSSLQIEKFEFRETDQHLTHFCLGGDICSITFRDGEFFAVTESPNLPFCELTAKGAEIFDLIKGSCPEKRQKKVSRKLAWTFRWLKL